MCQRTLIQEAWQPAMASQLTEFERFRCDVAREGDLLRIVLHGELDMATSATVERVLRASGEEGVDRRLLDLSGLTFMDSSGLRLILAAHAAARRERWSLIIVPGPPAVQRVFEISGVAGELRFVSP